MRKCAARLIRWSIKSLIRLHVLITGNVPAETGEAIDLDRAITSLWIAKERLCNVLDHLKRVRGS